MPSSRARRRRAQQRRGPGPQQTAPRRPATGVQPAQAAEQSAEALEAEVLPPVEEEVVSEQDESPEQEESPESDGGDDLDRGDEIADVEADLEDPGEDSREEPLEDGEGLEDEDDEEEAIPAPSGRRAAAALVESTPAKPRSQNRNRRRSATPQTQGPLVVRFFREAFDELRKVDWPSPSELYRYTIIVIITVIVLAAFISGIDWVLQELGQKFIYGSAAGVTG
ncbi:MAG: preprotein translocase subunit SecE [Candidatus Dormibacteraceae bacterium]